MAGKLWTPDEVATLHELRGVKGWDTPSIAKAMGRGRHSIRNKIEREGIDLPLHKKRGIPLDDVEGLFGIIRQAFMDGVAVKSVAHQTGKTKKFVQSAYNAFGRELQVKGCAPVGIGTYIGAKEMAAIAGPVCGVTAKAAMSGLRMRPAVLARMAIAKALRERGLSLTVIGNLLGGRDHATIVNLLERFPYYAKLYPELLAAYQAIKDAQEAAAVRLAA
jgi:hypothetical protein